MAPIAMFFGLLLTALGAGLYVGSDPDHRSVTALIPSFFGIALIILGVIARAGVEKVRMHTMHVAAVLALVGAAFPAYRAFNMYFADTHTDRPLAFGGQVAMALLCTFFLGFCIKSFVDARRRRGQQQS